MEPTVYWCLTCRKQIPEDVVMRETPFSGRFGWSHLVDDVPHDVETIRLSLFQQIQEAASKNALDTHYRT